MNAAEQYNLDWDMLREDTEERAIFVRQADNEIFFLTILTKARSVGMQENELLQIIDSHPEGLVGGARQLIDEIIRRQATRPACTDFT